MFTWQEFPSFTFKWVPGIIFSTLFLPSDYLIIVLLLAYRIAVYNNFHRLKLIIFQVSDTHSRHNVNSCDSQQFFFPFFLLLPPLQTHLSTRIILNMIFLRIIHVLLHCVSKIDRPIIILTVRGLISLSIRVSQIDHSHLRAMSTRKKHNSLFLSLCPLPLSFEKEFFFVFDMRIRRKTALNTLLTRAFILVTNNVIESRSWDRRATGSALPVFVLLRSPSRRNLDRKRCAQTIAESSMEMQTNLK